MQFGVLILLSTISMGCFSTSSSVSKSRETKAIRMPLPEIEYYVDTNSDGVFENVVLEEKPEPIQGENQMQIDFYTSIKYPALARENGIQGIVILDVLIDEFGFVQEVVIKKSVSKECDEEAKRVFISSIKEGYTPAKYNSKVVKCRMDMPVRFRLE